MKFAGADIARHYAKSMTRHTPEAILEGIANLRAAGADEILLVPATGHYDEVDRLAQLLR